MQIFKLLIILLEVIKHVSLMARLFVEMCRFLSVSHLSNTNYIFENLGQYGNIYILFLINTAR